MLDGAETIIVDGIETDDGTYVRWIGTTVDGKAGTVGAGCDGTHVQNPGVDG
jgi:hypothetical protein